MIAKAAPAGGMLARLVGGCALLQDYLAEIILESAAGRERR